MLGMYHSQLDSPTATPERLTHPPPSTASTLRGSLARKFNEVYSKPSASKSSSATVHVTETAVLDSLGLSKTVTSGFEVVGELFRLCAAKRFFVGDFTKSILFDLKFKHFVRIRPGLKEKRGIRML